MFIYQLTKYPKVPITFLFTNSILELTFDPHQTVECLKELHKFYFLYDISSDVHDCLKQYCCYNIVNACSYMRLFETHYPESEYLFAKKASTAYYYAESCLCGRFELGEEAISKNSFFSYAYAIYVLNGPFPLGETAIKNNVERYNSYLRFLKSKQEKT
jgi:hypothetical protein